MEFYYHPDILNRFPNLVGGVIFAKNLKNSSGQVELTQAFQHEQGIVKERIGDKPLSEIQSLASWRQAFRSFGVDPTTYRSACEALLRRLIKKGDIPSINTLVDCCNLVSIRYAVPIAALDQRLIQGKITVRFAAGNEQFNELDSEETEHPIPGEVIFIDDAGTVVARRWCWRQSAESAARLETHQAIFTIEAHHPQAQNDIQAAIVDLLALLRKYSDGEFQSGLLGQNRAALSWYEN